MSTDCICGTSQQPLCTDDVGMNECPHCKWIDMYAPCPKQGYGCGSGCDCCTPEQQASADGKAWHQYVESGSGFCAICDDMPGEGVHS